MLHDGGQSLVSQLLKGRLVGLELVVFLLLLVFDALLGYLFFCEEVLFPFLVELVVRL